jgi:hypothetical protein
MLLQNIKKLLLDRARAFRLRFVQSLIAEGIVARAKTP